MDKLRINFVSQGGNQLASHRLRNLRPAELLNTQTNNIDATVRTGLNPNAHVNVFNKHFDKKGNLVGAAEGSKKGYYSIFDICDDYFDREEGSYYKEMVALSDLVTCNSEKMKQRIYEVTGVNAVVIPDPVMFPHGEPKHSIDPKCVWFGHSSNAVPLHAWLEQLDGYPKVTAFCDALLSHPNVNCVQWKPNIVESHIHKFEIALLPTTEHEWTKCKSPNRAVDAIQAGLFVIADNSEVYKPLKKCIKIINDAKELPEAIQWYRENPEKVLKMIAEGQEFIKKTYGSDIVLGKWLGALKSLGLIQKYSKVVSNGS